MISSHKIYHQRSLNQKVSLKNNKNKKNDSNKNKNKKQMKLAAT